MRPSHRLLSLSAPLLLLLVLPLAAQAQSFCDFAPTVTVTATNGAVGVPVVVQVTASDPNGDAITSLTADTSALPAGNNAVFTANASNTAGTLTWTPQAGQTGNFTVTYIAANALSGSATATIHVVDTAGAPFVESPSIVTTQAFHTVTFDVYAGDPDGDPIASLTAAPLPSGATFTVDPGNMHGVFSWTPDFSSSGATITFTATNTLSGSSTTFVQIPAVDRAPVVLAPATAAGTENVPLSICVVASDPDGDALVSLTASGLPAGATFTAGAGNTHGTFNWTPTFTQAGSYNVTFTASNALSGIATTAISIANVDRAPVVTAPATASGFLNMTLSFTVSASDPDGDLITSLTAAPLPSGATFTPNAGNVSGTFAWTPTFPQGGFYNVTFTASNALSGSATTQIYVNSTLDRAPVVTAPPTEQVCSTTFLTFTVTASDPDGDVITSLTASGTAMTQGATFTASAGNTSGTFSWTPSFTAGGSYNVTFTAQNALTGTAATAITVNNCDRPPVVAAPATKSVAENVLLTFTVSASDPDGDVITSLTAAPLPSGATFTASPSSTSGTFGWTPTFTQAGSYSVTFTASNALSGSATTMICVGCADRAPVVLAPATASAPAGSLLSFMVSATDPDGDAVTSLTAAPLPSGATFTVNAANSSGTFNWTPTCAQSGSYAVTFTASNALAGSATTAISVGGCAPGSPVVTAPSTASVDENAFLSFTVSVTDPNGSTITSLTAAGLPPAASFTANASNTSGTFSWLPSFLQAGAYNVTFTAVNSASLSGAATTAITVVNVDRPPVVTAPASVTGAEGSPLSVTVATTDPDGDAITSLTAAPLPAGASFTVNPTHNPVGTLSWTPSAGQAGTYFVTFTASNALSGKATTTINVTGTFVARIFTTGGNKTIHLGSNRSVWCADIEPVNGDFALTDVIPASVVMISPGTGSVGQITAGGKTAVVGDQDNNGIEDLEVCFLKGDLRLLFSNLSGKQTVTVTLAGDLITGSHFQGTLTVDVSAGGGGGALAASVLSNGTGATSTIRFTTTRAGAVRVRVYDVSGRLVRSLVEDANRAAGTQFVDFDGRGDDGRRLASGIYLFRIEAAEDVESGRIAVLR